MPTTEARHAMFGLRARAASGLDRKVLDPLGHDRTAAPKRSRGAEAKPRPSRRTHLRLLRHMKVSTAPKLLDREDLWTPEFAYLYQSHCDDVIFGDPEGGLFLARLGLMLAARVHDPIPERVADTQASAYSVLGSALRANGNLQEAEQAYRRAMQRARRPAVRADALQRLARLLGELGKLEAALRAAEEAVRIFRNQPDDQIADSRSLATATVMRGWVHLENGSHQEALADFSEGLQLADPVRERRTYDSALQNTAYLLLSYGSVDDLSDLLNLVRALRRRYSNSRHRVVPRYQLLWLEGLLHSRLGLDRRAEKLMLRARDGLASKGQLRQVLQVSLDLLRLYLEWGEPAQVEQICSEILQLSPTASGREIAHPEIFGMIRLLLDGSADPERVLGTIRSLW
ncbi:MAG: tetratricopeptide repeat protein [Holophagales bacterium]|nr:tetratricopeptide repeat protein [Holophagales bacterium]